MTSRTSAIDLSLPPLGGVSAWVMRWLGTTGVAGRIALYALFLAMGLLALAGTVSFIFAMSLLNEKITTELAHESELVGQRVELALDGMNQQLASLATNSLTANALLDSNGRDIYLRPFLKDDRLTAAGAVLTLVDFRGMPVGGTGPEEGQKQLQETGAADIKKAIGSALPKATLVSIDYGHYALRIIRPVLYSTTGTAEGALILDVPLDKLLDISPRQTRVPEEAMVLSWSQPVVGAVAEHGRVHQHRPLNVAAPLNELGLALVVGIDRWAAYQPAVKLVLMYALVGTITLVLVVGFIRVRARRFAEPLAALTQVADDVAFDHKGEVSLVAQGEDEIARLARAFSAMLSRIRMAQAELETRVEDRTRELRLSENRLGSVLEALPDIVFSLNPEVTRYLYSSPASVSVLGSEYFVPGASIEYLLSRVHPDDERMVRDACATMILSGDADIVFRYMHPDGGIRWLHTRIRVVRDEKNHVLRFDGITTDITETKLAEDRLHESEQRWQLALLGANDGLWDWDIASERVYYSPRWKAMLGYAEDELTDSLNEWSSRVPPEDHAVALELLKQHLRRETPYFEAEFRMLGKDGCYRWILSRGRALWDEDGRAVRMVGSHTDISARKRFEAEVRDRNQQLGAIFTLSPDGFVTFDQDGLLTYVNPAFLRMTGLDGEALLMHDEANFDAALRAVLATDCAFPGVAECGRQRDERHLITLAPPTQSVLEVQAVIDETGSVRRLLYFRDVTHEVEVDRMKTEFLSAAAHELRTPMASIFGFTELLLAEDFDDATRKDLLQTIYGQTELLVRIINELLDLSRIEARRGKDFQLELISLSEVLKETLTGLHFDRQKWPVTVSVDEGIPQLRADPDKLRQVLVNVLSNATKYSPQGGAVDITLTLESAPENSAQASVRIDVNDHGIGMTPEQLERIFERFYRADSSGVIPGTGLGMSLVKEIVELHGGHVAVGSDSGAGTRVSIWLPFASDQVPGSRAAQVSDTSGSKEIASIA